MKLCSLISIPPIEARRPPHGGRGLKLRRVESDISAAVRRPPHGGRGLKWRVASGRRGAAGSPSPRRAWIEIWVICFSMAAPRRPPHGGRGLKFTNFYCDGCYKSRPPHGGRGLKSSLSILVPVVAVSPSPRRAWIEIDISIIYCNKSFSRPPHGGRGLKSFLLTASPG